MLKKAGIVAAAAAAGLLSLSPLAFAGSKDDHHHGAEQVNVNEGDDSKGLINVSGNNVNAPTQVCNNNVPINGNAVGGQVPVQDNDFVAPITGALNVFGSSEQDVDTEVDNSRSCEQGDSGAGDSTSQVNDD